MTLLTMPLLTMKLLTMTYLNEVPNARDAAHTRLLLLGVGAHQPGSQVLVVGVVKWWG